MKGGGRHRLAAGIQHGDWGGRMVCLCMCLCVGSCERWGWLLDERARIIYCLKLAGLSLIGVIYKQSLLVVPF